LVVRCKRSLKGKKTADEGVEVRAVERLFSVITRTDVAWSVFIIAGILLIFAIAVVIGMLLSSLSVLWGSVVALVLAVLVTGLLLPELRSFWEQLPR
jgi:uncharacterized membrane protein